MLSLSLLSLALAAPVLVLAQTPPYVDGFQLSNPAQLDGKICVTPAGGSAVVGAKLVMSPCANTAAQKISWVGTTVRSGTLCWKGASGSVDVTLATCNTADTTQNWNFNRFGRIITHKSTNRCLDLTGFVAGANTPVRLATCLAKGNAKQIWNPYFALGSQPNKAYRTTSEQFGYNQCGTNSTSSANCQTLWVSDINNFCLYAPPTKGAVGNMEGKVVSYCNKSGRGTRLIPDGTLTGVHVVKTKTYLQITGVGDFTKMNIPKGDSGGELDPHGATGGGNPLGGLVYGNAHGNAVQYHEWSSFISEKEFCVRVCLGGEATRDCQHIYDEMGCYWNQPGSYAKGIFESCNGENSLPAGIYGTSTYVQGSSPTPPAHAPGATSNCKTQTTVKISPLTAAAAPTARVRSGARRAQF